MHNVRSVANGKSKLILEIKANQDDLTKINDDSRRLTTQFQSSLEKLCRYTAAFRMIQAKYSIEENLIGEDKY